MMNKEKKIYFSNGVIIGQNCWCCAEDGQEICKTNIITGMTTIVKCLDERISGYSFYNSVIYNEERLYFIPLLSDVLLVYDINKNNVEEYEIDSNICRGKGAKFISAGIYKDNMYMFPCCADHVCRFNVISKEIEYLQNITNMQAKNSSTGLTYCFGTGVKCDEIFWLPVLGRDMIVAYSMFTNEYREYVIDSKEEGFRYLVKIDDDFYLLTRNGNVVHWNLERGFCKKYDNPNATEKVALGRNIYSKIVYFENAIWLFPAFGVNIVRIDLMSGERIEYSDYKDGLQESDAISEIGIFGEGMQNGEEVIMFPHTLNGLVRINLRSTEITTSRLVHNIGETVLSLGKEEDLIENKENVGKEIFKYIGKC